jgi:hypothetical protein
LIATARNQFPGGKVMLALKLGGGKRVVIKYYGMNECVVDLAANVKPAGS